MIIISFLYCYCLKSQAIRNYFTAVNYFFFMFSLPIAGFDHTKVQILMCSISILMYFMYQKSRELILLSPYKAGVSVKALFLFLVI